ncbi:MAG: phenylalanine--tRNA ligase subunit alpha, partial [Deltaproteobacteria bacterium]|nr:phenylalanine--tRNA ligase subunit alpha [Deltaproteobacteria bacterium]
MPSSLSSLDELQREAFDSLDKASTTKALEELRITYLGRQGKITELLKSLRDLDPSVRPEAGKRINDFKVLFEARLEEGLK